MSLFRKYVHESMTRRFALLMLLFFSLMVAGALVVQLLNHYAFANFQSAMQTSRQKQELLKQIAEHTNQIFFRARGYYAFLSPHEFNELFLEKTRLEQALDAFKQMPLNREEREMAASIESFVGHFFSHVFPISSRYAQTGDYEALRQFASSGINGEVNDLISSATRYQQQNEQLMLAQNERLFQELSAQSSWFMVYVLMALLILLWVTIKTTRDIGRPLLRLTADADRFAKGETPQLDSLERADEIGKLSRALDYMMKQIHQKEEALMAQNEKLHAQQGELMMQQEKLQEALAHMAESERDLEKKNRFVLALTRTQDKNELLSSIISSVVEIMEADKGVIVLSGAERDFASFGVSQHGMDQLLQGIEDGPFVRIKETGLPFVLKRESSGGERSFHIAPSRTYELYLPVLDSHGEVVACLILARIDRMFSEHEQHVMIGMAKQISLALDKLAMQEETKRQRQNTQDMLDSVQEGIQLLSPHGDTLQVNNAFCQLLGYDRRQAAADAGIEAFLAHLQSCTAEPARLVPYIKAVALDESGKPADSLVFELTHPVKRYIQLYAKTLSRHQRKWGTLLVYRDITKEYEIDQMKSEFVSTVSHELRTPLASVLGFAELLLHKDLEPQRQQRYMTAIYQEATRLTALINDFLDLQRMESGRQSYEIAKVEIVSLIREVFGMYRVQSTLHSFELELAAEQTTVCGDRDKLRQVFVNLISNAVKYSPRGGPVRVVLRNDRHRLFVDIHDEGLGIPAEALPHLFTRFYRVDNSDRREIGGTGLGLAIVSEIVRIHHGEVTVASEAGKGSTFTVSLPLPGSSAQIEQQNGPTAALLPSGPSIGKVVMIEDDLHLSELLREELLGAGFAVYPSATVQEALDAIHSLRPDAVVLDLILQDGESGWQVIEAMQDHPALKTIPIVISSALEEKKKAFELGAKGYLIKPYHPGTLVKAVLLAVTSREPTGQIFIPDSL
ncbi:ATP-binding protein [Brevibacillus sp. SAFN-007a]|uniref:ATP-binding protein n=1 Tax=Brevibacillus sp. SAFN-007a TaxID=3436862 RepID=UPI003F7D9D70